MEDYWQRGVDVAEKQYADLCEGIKNSLPSEWECRFVLVILGTMSISEKFFGEAMEQGAFATPMPARNTMKAP